MDGWNTTFLLGMPIFWGGVALGGVARIPLNLWDAISTEVCDETNRHRKTTVNFRCPAEWQSRSGKLRRKEGVSRMSQEVRING